MDTRVIYTVGPEIVLWPAGADVDWLALELGHRAADYLRREDWLDGFARHLGRYV